MDDDCDGFIDEGGADDLDADGVSAADGDCDDEDGWVRPGLPEWCDRIDNNCDGTVDEGCEGDTGLVVGDDKDEGGGCGCASAPAAAPLWGLGALLALWRRRRAA